MGTAHSILISSLVGIALAGPADAGAAERRVYEGVVSWKQATIGTVILLDIRDGAVSGWLRLEKPVAIDGGSPVADGFEFRSAGNTYRIDERRGRIIYSGPQGEGNRYLTSLTRLTGNSKSCWKRRRNPRPSPASRWMAGCASCTTALRPCGNELRQPFEKFSRLEEQLVGKEISVWVADADLRSGPYRRSPKNPKGGHPLKPPKKPKDQPQKGKPEKEKK